MTEAKSREKCCRASDICAIIEACTKAGVVSLKWRDLEVTFQVPGLSATTDLPKTYMPEFAPPESGQASIAMVDKDLLDDMRRSQLLLDDPAGFEQEVIDSHLRQGAIHAEP